MASTISGLAPTYLAQNVGGDDSAETTAPSSAQTPGIGMESAVLAAYEAALADGASLEEAAQFAYEAALAFGVSGPDAMSAVMGAVEATYAAFVTSGAAPDEAAAFARMAVEAVRSNEEIARDQQDDAGIETEDFLARVADQSTGVPSEIPAEPTPPIFSTVLDDVFLQPPHLDAPVAGREIEGPVDQDRGPDDDISGRDIIAGVAGPPPVLTRPPPRGDDTLDQNNTSTVTVVAAPVAGAPPDTTISGGSGNTTLTAGNGGVFLTSGSGDDTLTGGTGSDFLAGGAGNDTLSGGSGDDTYRLASGFGTDIIVDSAGMADRITGFSVDNLSSAVQQGNDLILGFYTGDTVTLQNHFQSGNEVEILVSGTDSFGLSGQTSGVTGQIVAGLASTNDTLSGATGNDVIFGGDGTDTVQGAAGDDLLLGGAGTDTVVLSGNFADYTITKLENGYSIVDSVGSRDGTDTIRDVENIQFADMTLAADAAITTPSYVTGVLFDDSYSRWNADTSLGAPVSLTYSFMTAEPSYYSSGEITSFSTFTTAQETAARTVLAQFSSISNLTFTEVADTGSGGQLRFGGSAQTSSAGFAFAPSVDYTLNSVNFVANEKGGDVFIANNMTSSLTLTDGSHGFYTMIHEVGHATGLTHPFSGTNQLSSGVENHQYSVMSYTDHPKSTVIDVTGDASGYSFTTFTWNPETPMLYDVAALQHLYGANMTTATGDDTYTYSTSARFFETIWDAGGTDTIDASNFTRASVIDLTPGSFSSIGIYNPVSDQLPSFYVSAPQPTYSGEDNVAIAYGAIIENGTGGSGDDTLTGNTANNVLTGGGGNDTLTGGAGNDSLVGDAGDDTYVLASGSGGDTITDSAGTSDRISGFTASNLANAVQQGNDLVLSFSTGDTVTVKNHFVSGGEVEIFVSGTDNIGMVGQTSGVTGQIITDPGTSGDILSGASGNDLIFGNEGADTLQGGAGNDTLTGGAGNDIFMFSTGDGNDAITDFSRGFDNIHLNSAAFGISTVSFEAIATTYDGTNASNASSNVIRDSSNDLYVDTNGQTAGGYSLVANVENSVAVDETDITLV